MRRILCGLVILAWIALGSVPARAGEMRNAGLKYAFPSGWKAETMMGYPWGTSPEGILGIQIMILPCPEENLEQAKKTCAYSDEDKKAGKPAPVFTDGKVNGMASADTGVVKGADGTKRRILLLQAKQVLKVEVFGPADQWEGRGKEIEAFFGSLEFLPGNPGEVFFGETGLKFVCPAGWKADGAADLGLVFAVQSPDGKVGLLVSGSDKETVEAAKKEMSEGAEPGKRVPPFKDGTINGLGCADTGEVKEKGDEGKEDTGRVVLVKGKKVVAFIAGGPSDRFEAYRKEIEQFFASIKPAD